MRYQDGHRVCRAITIVAVLFLLAFGLRCWLGPKEAHGPLDAALFAIVGVIFAFSQDRYGFSKSRYAGVRVLGRTISIAFGAAFLIAAVFILMGK